MPAIVFDHVSKRFVLHHERARSFQDLFLQWFTRKNGNAEEYWALQDISLEVPQGQMIGIIGPNGAGKSTLLKLLARVYEPTRGRISVAGRLNALIELGAGMHPDLTGRENVFLVTALMGLSRRETQKRFDEIVAFSELERFIDMPVKHYSSGMHVRLGFAIASCIESDVLLVDEVLAVGDANFKRKCIERIGEIREAGTTIFFVTHNILEVERSCDRAVLLISGKLICDSLPAQVTEMYDKLQRETTVQQEEVYGVEYLSVDFPPEIHVGDACSMRFTFRNNSHEIWSGSNESGTRRVFVSYHWLDQYDSIIVLEGVRTSLPQNLAPGESITVQARVLPPPRPGSYHLECDLAMRGGGWFSRRGYPGPQVEVQVLPSHESSPAGVAAP